MNVGDKVVCITMLPYNTNGTVPATDPKVKIAGEIPMVDDKRIWVIRGIVLTTRGQLGLKLIGSTVICTQTGYETGWNSICFRKLDELKQEASQRQYKSA